MCVYESLADTFLAPFCYPTPPPPSYPPSPPHQTHLELREFWRGFSKLLWMASTEKPAIHFLGNSGLTLTPAGNKLIAILRTLTQAHVAAPLDMTQEGIALKAAYFDTVMYDTWMKERTSFLFNRNKAQIPLRPMLLRYDSFHWLDVNLDCCVGWAVPPSIG